MKSDEAAWVRSMVLVGKLGGDRSVCACQYGACGHCGVDNHHKCTTPRLEVSRADNDGKPSTGSPAERFSGGSSCETYIVDRKSRVMSVDGKHARVWRVGTACRWICSCEVCRAVDSVLGRTYPHHVVEAPGNPLAFGRVISDSVLDVDLAAAEPPAGIRRVYDGVDLFRGWSKMARTGRQNVLDRAARYTAGTPLVRYNRNLGQLWSFLCPVPTCEVWKQEYLSAGICRQAWDLHCKEAEHPADFVPSWPGGGPILPEPQGEAVDVDGVTVGTIYRLGSGWAIRCEHPSHPITHAELAGAHRWDANQAMIRHAAEHPAVTDDLEDLDLDWLNDVMSQIDSTPVDETAETAEDLLAQFADDPVWKELADAMKALDEPPAPPVVAAPARVHWSETPWGKLSKRADQILATCDDETPRDLVLWAMGFEVATRAEDFAGMEKPDHKLLAQRMGSFECGSSSPLSARWIWRNRKEFKVYSSGHENQVYYQTIHASAKWMEIARIIRVEDLTPELRAEIEQVWLASIELRDSEPKTNSNYWLRTLEEHAANVAHRDKERAHTDWSRDVVARLWARRLADLSADCGLVDAVDRGTH